MSPSSISDRVVSAVPPSRGPGRRQRALARLPGAGERRSLHPPTPQRRQELDLSSSQGPSPPPTPLCRAVRDSLPHDDGRRAPWSATDRRLAREARVGCALRASCAFAFLRPLGHSSPRAGSTFLLLQPCRKDAVDEGLDLELDRGQAVQWPDPGWRIRTSDDVLCGVIRVMELWPSLSRVQGALSPFPPPIRVNRSAFRVPRNSNTALAPAYVLQSSTPLASPQQDCRWPWER